MIMHSFDSDNLSDLTKKLEIVLNKQESSENESFNVYLELCACMFKNNSSIRDVFKFISKIKSNHIREQINKLYPDTSDPDRDSEWKKQNQEASDKMTLIGNKILQFLSDINENRIGHNADYIILQQSLNDIQRETLSKWITELPNEDVFQRVVNPEKLEEERLFLTVNHCRNGLKSIQEEVIDTIVNLSKTQQEKIVDLTVDELDQYWNTNHPNKKKT